MKKGSFLLFSLLLFLLIIVILGRIFIFDIFKIPSSSMSPTLVEGDYILVNKLAYGHRVINFRKLFVNKKLEYSWSGELKVIKKNDVVVFNQPAYWSLQWKYPEMFGAVFIKRCLCPPNDTVLIQHKGIKNCLSEINSQSTIDPENFFPHDSTLQWNINNYGPLWVPAKDRTITLTPENIRRYKDMILYEGFNCTIKNDSVFLNNVYAVKYRFRYNYYFMMGDNFYYSQDSRYWGFLPETHVIGKAEIILCSFDWFEPWFKSIRWNRIFKLIE